jgi:hypothetical protein
MFGQKEALLRVKERTRKSEKNKNKTNGPSQGHSGWVLASETQAYLSESQVQDSQVQDSQVQDSQYLPI